MRRTIEVNLHGLSKADAIKALKKIPRNACLEVDDEGVRAEWDDGKKAKYRAPPKRTRPLTLSERLEETFLFSGQRADQNGLAYWITRPKLKRMAEKGG
jgi:hypothetical protein